MNPLPLLAATALLVSPVLAEASADVPAPTAEELASPLPPLEVTEAEVQAMQQWVDCLRAIGGALNGDKAPDTKAAELQQLLDQAKSAGEGAKKVRFWKRLPALRQLGMGPDAVEKLAQPMVDCGEAGYHGSAALEKVMDELAHHLLTTPISDEQGEEDGTMLPAPQIAQEYLSIVHGVRDALAAGKSDEQKALAMELLTMRLFRMGDMISSDNIRDIRSEIERRMDEVRAAHQAAGALIRGLGEDVSPELSAATRRFCEEIVYQEEHLLP